MAVRLKLDIPELLRPHSKPPPMTIAQIEKVPLWAQPPFDDCVMRVDWAHVHVNYRARVLREFGQDIFIQYPGWWQEVIKGSQGRVAVKSDDHYYTVYCYLPGHTPVTLAPVKSLADIKFGRCLHLSSETSDRDSVRLLSKERYVHQLIASHGKADVLEHFHWKIELPQAEFKHITTRMNGTTLTVQSK
jgi:hypothetical protein